MNAATRARSAAVNMSNAVQSAAKIARMLDEKPSGLEPEPRKHPRSLLDQLELSVRYVKDDTRRLQPKIGGKVVLERSGEEYALWLPADVWQGIASIICQTPNHHRAAVAMFLTLIETFLGQDAEPLRVLVEEIGREVVQQEYEFIPEDDRNEFDVCWT